MQTQARSGFGWQMLPHCYHVATIASMMMLDDLPNAFSYRTAQDQGLSDRLLHALVAHGALERLGHGLYRKTAAPPRDIDQIEIALRAPHATICLVSALSYHDLTDAIPAALDVALPRTQRQPKVHAAVRWHRFQDDTFGIGRQVIEVDHGLTLGVYGAERSVIDAFRLRHQEGEETAVEALRRWLKRPGAMPADLLAMARHFPKAEPSLLAALRILL
jgi:predicted transcriptional regulator of viral defense system